MNIPDMRFDENGLQEYYWPVSFTSLMGMRDTALREIASLCRDIPMGTPGGTALRMCSHYLLTGSVGLFNGQALYEASIRDGREVQLPVDALVWKALFVGQTPVIPVNATPIIKAFPPKNLAYYYKKHTDKLRKRFAPAAKAQDKPSSPKATAGVRIASGSMKASFLREQVVCTKRGAIQQCHAVMESRKVGFLPHKNWYRPLKQRAVAKAGVVALPLAVQQRLLDCLEAGFLSQGVSMPGPVRDGLSGLMLRLAGAMHLHLERLLAAPDKLPKTLWTGSCGNPWDRMLRFAVLETGGQVTGHSHAGGQGYMTIPTHYSNEFLACTEFAMYSKGQADLVPQSSDASMLLDGTPRLTVVDCPSPAEPEPHVEISAGPPRKLMYIAPAYNDDRIRLSCNQASNTVLADWQYRLFSHLKNSGLDVLYKVHPDVRTLLPPALTDEIGIELVGDYFERVMGQSDILLFDQLGTTAFNVALLSNMPMVYVDFGLHGWTPHARALFEKRCAVVHARHDENNRAQVDWQELDRAIARAASLRDNRELANAYLSGIH